MKKKEILYLVLLITISTVLGFLYSIHQTDSHHWGFIVSTALDYIQGKSLFTEVYVQYGMGQMVLFKWLHSLITINITTIGWITSVIYSLHLLLIFWGAKKISNPKIAILMTTLAFLIHTYVIYPWSDYYAGLCLTLSCSLLIGRVEEKRIFLPFLVGSTLFLCCFFRNTYFFSIGFAGIAYVGVSFFNQELRDKRIHLSLLFFFLFCFAHVFFIFRQGRIHEWYIEGIGTASSGRYHLEPTSILHLLQKAFLPLQWKQANYMAMVSLAILLYLTLNIVWSIAFKKDSQKFTGVCTPGALFFISSVGLAGLLQALHGYEVFRVQNACGPIYFATAAFLVSKYPNFHFPWKNKKVLVAIALFFFLHLIRFPTATAYFPIIDGDFRTFSESKIPYFKWHRFQTEERNYYEDLARFVCGGDRKIMNLTMDSAIPHLCGDEKGNPLENEFNLSFFEEDMVAKINPTAFKKFNEGMFELGTVIVSESATFQNRNPSVRLMEVGRVIRPGSIRFFKSVPVYVFHVVPLKD